MFTKAVSLDTDTYLSPNIGTKIYTLIKQNIVK
jgi:hypothetical protein